MIRVFFYLAVIIISNILFSCEKGYLKTEVEEEQDASIHEELTDYYYNSDSIVNVTLQGSSISASDNSVSINNSIAKITKGGVYRVTGSLGDGQVVVEADEFETVKIILDNANVNCSTNAPLKVESALKVIVFVSEGTENILSDGSSYGSDEETNAALFSKTDITICGTGLLSVTSNYKDAIASKDGLIIKDGNIQVSAVDDGIRGKDYLNIENSVIEINASGDGLYSDNESNNKLGCINVASSEMKIKSGGDGVSAFTSVYLEKVVANIISGGGSNSNIGVNISAKGIKTGTLQTIMDCEIDIDAADDAIHSNESIKITGGTLSLSSADDGLHAEDAIDISNSQVAILKSVEGIEAMFITVESGEVKITAEDDGFNATCGVRGEADDGSELIINDGYIVINCTGGDALDSNGSISISGGTIIAHGPRSQPEVGMDYNGECKVNGGELIVSGPSSMMAQAPSTSSGQNSVMIYLSTSISTNTLLNIQDEAGNSLVTFIPERSYSTFVFSSPDILIGSTYKIFTGGSSTGTNTDGIMASGEYTPGTLLETFTVSGNLTTVGSGSSSGPGGGPGGGPR